MPRRQRPRRIALEGDASRCHQNSVGCMVTTEATYSSLPGSLRCRLGFMEEIKEGRNEQESDKDENHYKKNRLDLGRFDVKHIRFLIKYALWLYAELPRAGSTFS